MNFSLVRPGDNDYNKIMMQKHWDQKRKKKDNSSMIASGSWLFGQQSRASNLDGLPLADQTLINNGYSPLVSASRNKQINQQTEKMRKLIKDQLLQSLIEKDNKKKKEGEQQKKLKKLMSQQNGMLDYLQKQIQKRDNFIKMCIVNQQKRKSHFIDEDLRRHRKALDHIEQNLDADVFNHQSDRYQQRQKLNLQEMLETNSHQAQHRKISKQMERSQYGKYLDQKYIKQRHNPITNPMQYHIENPYLRKKIQRY